MHAKSKKMKIFLPFAPTMKTYSLNIQQYHFCDNEKWLNYELRGACSGGYIVQRKPTSSGEPKNK